MQNKSLPLSAEVFFMTFAERMQKGLRTLLSSKGRSMTTYTTIAESKNFIVLDKYTKQDQVAESYQSEDALERELIQDLQNQLSHRSWFDVPGLELFVNIFFHLQDYKKQCVNNSSH